MVSERYFEEVGRMLLEALSNPPYGVFYGVFYGIFYGIFLLYSNFRYSEPERVWRNETAISIYLTLLYFTLFLGIRDTLVSI